jgi:hypothetical protein
MDKKEATKGNRKLYTTKPLDGFVKKELTKRVFTVISLGSLAAQKDELYDSIEW